MRSEQAWGGIVYADEGIYEETFGEKRTKTTIGEDVIVKENGDGTEEVVIPKEDALPDEDVLLEQYIEEVAETVAEEAMFSEVQSALPKSSARYWKLDYAERKAYLAIKDLFEKVASGETESTSITIKFSELFPSDLLNSKFTAEDLGVDAIFENGTISSAAVNALIKKYSFDTGKLLSALMADYPQLMYWFDKTVGMASSVSRSFMVQSVNGKEVVNLAGGSSFSFKFSVSNEYIGDSRFVTDASKTSAITTALENAAAIVESAKGLSDYEKLVFYKDKICELVTYNKNTASLSYGNPWQLLYVFDNDNSTNVVCEGYAKAFKLLCDLTDFDNESIECYTVSGIMSGGTGAGGHMWNVVSIDGKSYLADITNCDSGTIGYPDKLFLVGSGSADTSSSYTINLARDIKYTYDSSSLSLYDTLERAIASTNYVRSGEATTPTTEPVVAHTHEWNAGTITKKATCTATGIKTYTCKTDSSHTKTEVIPATGHTASAAVRENVVAATTAKAGSYDEVVYCSTCHAEISRKTYTIAKLPTSVTAPTAKTGLIYNGKAQTGVASGTNYTVKNGSATKVGTYTATVSLKDKTNYKWSDGTTSDKTIKWSIAKASVTSPTAKTGLIYNGKAQTGVASGTNYTVKNGSATKVGTYTATISLKDKTNYKWSDGTTTDKKITWKITSASIAKATVTGIATKTYTGKALTQVATVKLGTTTLKNGTDYTVAYKNNTKVGTATVIITGKGNYTGTITKTFKINAASIARYTVSGITAKNYTGKALTQNITVKNGSVTLKNGTDYTVAYKNNTKVGTATVTITGKGNYTGKITRTFTINLSGTYRIVSTVNKNYSMEVAGGSEVNGANIRLAQNSTANAQKFTITKVGNYYKIINKASGKAVDLKSAKASNGNNIQSYGYNATKAQLWTMRQNADGSFTFVSAVNSSYVIDLSAGKAVVNQNIQIYKNNNTKAQKWILTSV